LQHSPLTQCLQNEVKRTCPFCSPY